MKAQQFLGHLGPKALYNPSNRMPKIEWDRLNLYV